MEEILYEMREHSLGLYVHMCLTVVRPVCGG